MSNIKDKSSTFGKSLVDYVSQKLPYNSFQTIDKGAHHNPKYKAFEGAGVRRSEVLTKHSVALNNQYNNSPIAELQRDNSFQHILYASLNQDKGARLQDYRSIAAFSEVTDALDEICDEFINPDNNGDVCKLKFRNIQLNEVQNSILQKEFTRFVDYFEFQSRGWQYVRQYLVEGEIFFENIIHKDHVEEGVLGLVNVPSELIDPVYNNLQNLIVKGFLYRKPVMDPKNPEKIEKFDFIPLQENQCIYINSGVYDQSKTFILPILENARRPYRQLSLIEDSIVIYRLVRAPERLVFNVDVGNLPPPKAEAHLRKLIQQYWSTKTFDLDQNDVVQKFNPQSMLDAYWFTKRNGQGTDVTTLPGGQNLGQLDDLMYFIKKLYRSLKIPTTRLDPQDAFRDGGDILREELKFARYVIRHQSRFANAIKKGFITHLKLKQLWEKFELTEPNIVVEFNPPTNFYDLRENQKLELKAQNYSSLTADPMISKTFAQKKYLGYSDLDILANREYIRKDAEFQWEIQQITTLGPNWQDAMQAGATGADGMGDMSGSAMAGGGAAPPAFGGGGGIPAAETPPPEEQGGETETPPVEPPQQ